MKIINYLHSKIIHIFLKFIYYLCFKQIDRIIFVDQYIILFPKNSLQGIIINKQI